ncbi:MAG: universal stress protein [Anaerolineae bacterium]|nr:universal stress protein [Anaerolineae bacterium]
MFKKILVPLDGSQLSEFALNPALALAQANKAELILMSAIMDKEMVEVEVDEYYETSASSLTPPNTMPMRARMENYLDSIAETRAGIGVPIRTLVLEGDAASCVVETAVSLQPNLIIMGTHGRSGVSRLLLGSVTQKVWHQAPCPVMAVRDAQPIKNILMPIDQELLAEHALDPGFAIGSALSAQVHLLIVSQDSALMHGDDIEIAPGEKPFSQKLAEDMYNQEGAYLVDLEERYGTVKPITAVRGGKEEDVILAYAAENNIDLIVCRSSNRRWFQTSISDKVMRDSQSSLLVLKR